jgi:hypothetical protein
MDGSLNGNGHASGLVNGGGEDAEGRAEQGGLVGLRGIKASPGRPNISAVLARTVQEYSGDQEIGVVAAGAVHLVRRLSHLPLLCWQDTVMTFLPGCTLWLSSCNA